MGASRVRGAGPQRAAPELHAGVVRDAARTLDRAGGVRAGDVGGDRAAVLRSDGAAARRRRRRGSRPSRRCWRRISRPSSTPASKRSSDGNRHVPGQLHGARDHLQDRLLRTGPVREDDQSAVRLRPRAGEPPRADGVARHPDRPDPVLRLPAPGAREHLGLHDQVSALHRAGAELLQRHAEAGAAGRRRRRVRRRQPGPPVRRQPRKPAEPAGQPAGAGRGRPPAAGRVPVQQAGSAAAT